MKKFLTFILSAIVSTAVFADNVLVVHMNYVGPNVQTALENAGHTVTMSTVEIVDPTVLAQYDQIWDTRYNSLSSSAATAYDTFVKNGGFLYLTTENPGCCQARNDVVATLISNMGGGSGLTIGGAAGYASNTITQVNTTYMTPLNGSTIAFAAVSAIVNYGNGQWLMKDASDKVVAVMWAGGAGNLDSAYAGTVITVADINWIDSTRYVGDNIIALDDIINGIVAGTVAGTITASGNGGGGGSVAPSYSSEITAAQQSLMNDALSRRNAISGNNIYINQNGFNNNITITQEGYNNKVSGVASTDSKMYGDSNIVKIKQGTIAVTGKNLVELDYNGDTNNITVYQDRLDDGTVDSDASGNHIARLNITGDTNTISSIQRNNLTSGITEGHFTDITVNGGNNTIGSKQISDFGKIAFINVQGSSNSVSLIQQDNSQHYIDITLNGNGHNITANQKGNGGHKATINLTNAGGASTLNLIQQGDIQQIYSIEQLCVDINGCSVSITQGQ